MFPMGDLMARKYKCVGGPHDGEWHVLDAVCYKILLCNPKPAGSVSHPVFPSLENIKREFDGMIERTMYVVKDGRLVPE